MTTPTHTVSPGVRPITLDGAGVPLSGLLIEPPHTPPRAVVVALHGAGMRAGYFDGQAHPSLSLLALGARLGYTVLAVDRPGYGASADRLPEGQTAAEQAATLNALLRSFAADHAVGAGLFVVAHSYGGKVALTMAADRSADGPAGALIGLDVSGCGHRYAAAPGQLGDTLGHGGWKLNWGALRLYPPDTFHSSGALVAPVPARERHGSRQWPGIFPGVAARVRVPTRLTFAEHESWWRHDVAALDELSGMLAAPRLVVDRQPGAGHNISLGWSARTYHLRALAFLEECLAQRETAVPARRAAGV